MSLKKILRSSFPFLIFIFVFFGVFAFLNLRDMSLGSAVSLDNFNPGNIITDYVMSKYDSMTEKEIQAFLDEKGNCNDTRTYLADYYTKVSYHIENGHFVCLADETFGDGTDYGEDAEDGDSAAHIIYEAAHDYKINPQVLIVLLQKEQGLITDSWPNSVQYRSATGYGCPDTAACSTKYYGFKNQVRNAANLFRTVLDGGWTNYPLGNNYIQYNPDSSCGGSTVYIENLATSSLYRYTPYQPNASSLAAGYGTGNSCGAYGNRNFYLYFNDWFGSSTEFVELPVEAETNFEQPILDGEYQIVSKAYPDKAIDIRGGIKDGMTSAETIIFSKKTDYSNAKNQIFNFSYDSKTGYYNIDNIYSDLSFDVKGNSIKNSTPIIMWRHNSGCNQQWLLERDNDGYYSIISRCSSKVLDATSNNALIIFARHDGNNQKWQLVPVQSSDDKIENGVYQITSDDKALDISGGVTAETTSGDVVLFSKKPEDSASIANQLFEITYNSKEASYEIKNPTPNLLLKEKRNVVVSKSTNSCDEQWIIKKREDSGYNIISRCSGKGLTVSSDIIGSSKAITTSYTPEESWKFTKHMIAPAEEEPPVEPEEESSEIDLDVDYQLISSSGDKALDISGGVTAETKRGNVVAFRKKETGLENQTIRFEYDAEKDEYLIYNPTSNLYLDVAGASKEEDASVIFFPKNGNCNQRWKIKKSGDTYKISSVCSNKNLAISETTKIGSAYSLAIFSDGSSSSELWSLKEL